jgi:hypothetical protein
VDPFAKKRTLTPAGKAPMGWQQQIDNQISEPAELHGLPNGGLPDSVLSDIHDGFGNWTGKLCHTAARSWEAMQHAAVKDGVHIGARDPGTSPSSSYRSLAEQQGLWNDNYTTTPTNNGGRTCGGQYRYLRDGKNTAACPGTSNHGRGLAVDANVEVAGVLGWFEANAKTYGWQWEIASEEWHIHYCPGDTIPQAVLDFEGHQPSKEDDMPYIAQVTADFTYQGEKIPAGYAVYVVGQVRHYITLDQYKPRVANGCPVRPTDPNEMTDLFDMTVTDVHRLLKA